MVVSLNYDVNYLILISHYVIFNVRDWSKNVD